LTRSPRSIDDLYAEGILKPGPELDEVGRRYAVSITPEMRSLIGRSEAIARQFVPDIRELEVRPEERPDPIGDEAHSPVPGIVHRYPDRVLLKPTHACPVYCRFCFRREMVGPGGHMLTEAEITRAMDYVQARQAIWEVIVTGGDPLMLSPRRIERLVLGLGEIRHVAVVRWHSRVPLVDPARVTPQLVSALTASSKRPWMAVHCNHPLELTQEGLAALRRLAEAGIVLLSQTVLLKGVNDDEAVLETLMRRLVEAGVKPYYLHQLDLAPGTSHFRVDLRTGQAIMRALRARLSGIALPTYVLDIPEGYGKVPIGPSYIEDALGDVLTAQDPFGGEHRYPPRRKGGEE
jgi:lysine 2,3-aminomutase